MRLIGLAVVLTLGLVLAPFTAEGQQTAKIPRIGVLSGQPEGSPRNEALRQGLREFGYVEGHNIAIEWRSAHGQNERFADLAAEMVRLKVDAIVGRNDAAVEAARRKTKTIPIVMVQGRDPVGSGFVGSFARPGGQSATNSAPGFPTAMLKTGTRSSRTASRAPGMRSGGGEGRAEVQ